jgi:tetratricopeptide (TPR) repeat protein
LNEVRCLAYLTLVQRRAQRLGSTGTLAEEALQRALAANMLDYVGLARASLGWVAFKKGEHHEARQLMQEAVNDWTKLSFEYPFQWTGLLPLLALQLDHIPLDAVVAVAAKLLDKRLARLPDAVEESLSAALSSYEVGQQPQTREHVQRALAHASAAGFL